MPTDWRMRYDSALGERDPAKVSDATLAPLHELFQTCNLARYAPIKTSQELAAIIPRAETVLNELQKIKIECGAE